MSQPVSTNKPQNLPPLFLNYMASEDISLSRIILLTLYDFFDWWYIEMPMKISKIIGRISTVILDQFSIGTLTRTFFVPWHRDHKPIGYFMGIVMRILYIPIATMFYLFIMVISISALFGWILLPIITLIMIFATPIIN